MAISLTDDETIDPADARKAELLAQYPDWRVTDPGKFESESIETIYFYELMLDGVSDESIELERDCFADIFVIDDEDRVRWELHADTAYVMLETSEQGFVSLTELTEKEYTRLQAESTDAVGPQEDDITTSDHRTFYQGGKLAFALIPCGDSFRLGKQGRLLSSQTYPTVESAVRAYMERTNYWPNCWWISDHGNAHRIEL
jgi:hypothetical protein